MGNTVVVRSLRAMLKKPGKPHSILFTGISGGGKTTLARIVAHELGCEAADYKEMDSASYRGIDAIRRLRQEAKLKPMSGGVKVYLLDEAHQLTGDAQNALLKLLEEGPRFAYFLLATTDPDKLKETIKTRCAQYEVQALKRNQIKGLLQTICKAEKITTIDDEALMEIGRVCQGSARRSIKILEQVCGIEDQDEQWDAIIEAAGDEFQVIELCRALAKGQSWKFIRGILKGIHGEPETIRRQIGGYFDSVILNEADPQREAEIAGWFTESFFHSGHLGLTIACFMASRIDK